MEKEDKRGAARHLFARASMGLREIPFFAVGGQEKSANLSSIRDRRQCYAPGNPFVDDGR